jgi:hypothetical protein
MDFAGPSLEAAVGGVVSYGTTSKSFGGRSPQL